jgi:hypothetical protein
MKHYVNHFLIPALCGLLFCLLVPLGLQGQGAGAQISGAVTDPQGAVIPNAMVTIVNKAHGISRSTQTNSTGIYTAPFLPVGVYRITVQASGFQTAVTDDVELHVADLANINFTLKVGSVNETVNVSAGGELNVNTTDASVSTVVDRQFVEKMPLNGRSFQDLLTLTPGVTLVRSSGVGYSGELTVNGQRTEANYFTVDGVSANTGTAFGFYAVGLGFSGSVSGETVLGTTSSLVSIDALQEFRSTTSTYSAEYGRTPGGQFSLSTRSGTNTWHGSLYDYFRNEVLDANNWFNNAAGVSKTPERQNDFGGTLGGPLTIPGLYHGQDKTFFFISYEGLRLRVPQPFTPSFVPDTTLRQQAPAALRPFLNVFPLPNGGEDGLNDGLAFFNYAYSAPFSTNTLSVRVDHSFGDKLKLFGRYSDAPSNGWSYGRPANKFSQEIKVQTLTLGATSLITPSQANELRFNITQNNMSDLFESTSVGGAIPLNFSLLPGPNGQPLQPQGSQVGFYIAYGGSALWSVGNYRNAQRQYNLTDTYAWSRGTHQFRFGVDWRRLATAIYPLTTSEIGYFFSEASLLANSADYATNAPSQNYPAEPVYHNFSAFIQDEWRTTRRLSLSLGLRWDVNPAPGNLRGPSPYTVDQVTNLATAKLASAGTALWNTDWHGFAPRLGVAYQLRQQPGHETVLRSGFGMFYDMGNVQGSSGFQGSIGIASSVTYFGVPFPLTSAQVTLPAPSVVPPYQQPVYAFDPNLKLPYTMEWNVAVQQGLGGKQTITASYVGSAGRRLLTTFYSYPNSLGNTNFAPGAILIVTSNRANSNYNALQMKYEKSFSHGIQALASYTWSHSIDEATSNFGLYELLRASSDFDVRHNFQAAVTYDVPGKYKNRILSAVLEQWGLDWRISAHSALPVDIIGSQNINPVTQQYETFHPNVVPGQPLYLYGSQYPGGRVINYNAFTPAPAGVDGNTGRNSARGFDAVQLNMTLRRDFPIHERLHLQFRADAFNVLNHPMFSGINNYLSYGPSLFGYASNTLNQRLGGLSALYQSGGPRSLQLVLKLQF